MSRDDDPPRPERTVFLPAFGGVGGTGEPLRGEHHPPRPDIPLAANDDDLPDPPPRAKPRSAMVEAAAPLLALAAAVRSGRVDIDLRALHRRAAAAGARFDELVSSGGYDEETRRRARYAVFATVDDIAQNLPGRAADGAEWARRSMVVRGFGENIGGDRFWQLLGEMLSRPSDYLELIELYHACLAAGFEGRYRLGDDGGKLRATLRSAYAAMPQLRSLSEVELVPAWRGVPTPRPRRGPWSLIILGGSVLAALLLLFVLILRLVLMQTGEPSMRALQAVSPGVPLRLSRVATPPTIATGVQQRRVGRFLQDEVVRGRVVVEQDANSLRVRTTVGTLFRSGSDSLAGGSADLFRRIASAIESEKGDVRIEGHADSDPVSSLTFPDNVSLSQARADQVASIFRRVLSDPSRVHAQGFGAARPVASNSTPDGKALNRRVEIVVPRSE